MRWRVPILCLAIGITIGVFAPHLPRLEFKYDFDVADIFNFVVTLIATFYIGAILSRQYSNIRVEKDILISQVNQILSIVERARIIFKECFETGTISDENRRAILSTLKSFANELAFLDESLESCDIRSGKTEINSLRSNYSEFRIALTGGGFPGAPYSIGANTATERIYKQIRRNLNSFMLKINRS